MLSLFAQPSEQCKWFFVGLSSVVSYPVVQRNCAGLWRAMPPLWKPAAHPGDAVGMLAGGVQLSAGGNLVWGK